MSAIACTLERPPGPNWESSLQDQALWHRLLGGTSTLPPFAVQLWPRGVLGRRLATGVGGFPVVVMVSIEEEKDESNVGVFRGGWRASWGCGGRTKMIFATHGPLTQLGGGPAYVLEFGHDGCGCAGVAKMLRPKRRPQQEPLPPANASHRPMCSPSPALEEGQCSYSQPTDVCQECTKPICAHILDAVVLAAVRVSADHYRADSLLRIG